jgi:hypothetical protein
MVCIWSTSAQLTWGVASIHAIILNMHTWASRLLKPKIQHCVQQLSTGTRPSIPPNSQVPTDLTPPTSIYRSSRSPTPSRSPTRPNKAKRHAQVSPPGAQTATSNKTDHVPAEVNDMVNAFASSSLEESSYIHRRDVHAVSPGSGRKIGKSEAESRAKAPPNLQASLSDHDSVNNRGRDDGSRYQSMSKKGSNFTSKSRMDRKGSTTATPGKGISNKIAVRAETVSDSDNSVNDTMTETHSKTIKTAARGSTTSKQHHTGTACTPFSPVVEKFENTISGFIADHFQTITFQSPYQEYSLEELRMADYEQDRRYPDTNHQSNDALDDLDSQHDEASVNQSNCRDGSDGANTPLSRPLSGDRRIDMPTLKVMMRDLSSRNRRSVRHRVARKFRNSDGTYSIPRALAVKHINKFLKPGDHIV